MIYSLEADDGRFYRSSVIGLTDLCTIRTTVNSRWRRSHSVVTVDIPFFLITSLSGQNLRSLLYTVFRIVLVRGRLVFLGN